ncbi:hypothetical protein F4813DRAFT_384754 [Daldinia decipiens]|uniref:uncharacterized protein n=1 Tax=Daldinia decipiens TaxID=326647 RepID=UPI0020C54FDA|nr:uncharacterized protein F4813DRAFT_384754 [Daldinia decipiens]KAI1662038.1 hypothetical protein F4813DRAFT_384754 [Daldinia decipiens]
MLAYFTVLFAVLGVARAAQITGSCPSGQTLISNNKCCPGYSIISGENHTDCCITEQGNNGNCHGVGLCGNAIGTCKAKISVDDPDYDQKVQDALSGTTASQSSSSPSSSAETSPVASSTPSPTGSDLAPGSSTSSGSSSTSSSTSGATTTENNKAMLAMVAALAAIPLYFTSFKVARGAYIGDDSSSGICIRFYSFG